jgi:hypothetical protein
MLLKHDAEHAKELAIRELELHDSQYRNERKIRDEDKKRKLDEIARRMKMLNKLNQDEQRQKAIANDNLYDEDEENKKNNEDKYELEIADKQKVLKDYEMAFQRIREATGVHDVNEVI